MSTVITQSEAKNNISENIRDILDALGWNTLKLAQRAGVPQNTMYRIVRGEAVPDLVQSINIADALGISVERLSEKPRKFSKVG